MSDHPRYRGPVIDAHGHSDGAHRDAVLHALEAAGIDAWLNLWNTEWPPPSFERWQAEMGGGEPGPMALGHAPDLSGIGTDGFADELEAGIQAAAQAGAASLKVWKNLGLTLRDTDDRLVAVDDRRLDPLWRAAAEVQLPIVIHIADPVAFFEPMEPSNERWDELRQHPDWWFGGDGNPGFEELIAQLETILDRHPETTFIGAHMGCYAENLGRVAEMLAAHANFHIDTSARIAEIGRGDPDEVRTFFVDHADRILFGSDFCRTRNLLLPDEQGPAAEAEFFARYWRYFETDATGLEHPIPVQGAWRVDGIDLPDAVLDALYCGNASRLLPRLAAPVLSGGRP